MSGFLMGYVGELSRIRQVIYGRNSNVKGEPPSLRRNYHH